MTVNTEPNELDDLEADQPDAVKGGVPSDDTLLDRAVGKVKDAAGRIGYEDPPPPQP